MKISMLSTLAVLFLLSVPSANAQNNTIYACAGKVTGNLRMVSGPSTCLPFEKEVSWNVQGPPGPSGQFGMEISFDAQSVLPPQLLNPSEYTLILMPEISLNDGNGYSGTTSQFTVPIPGVYQFNANVSIDSGGENCAFILSLFLNNNELRRLSRTGVGGQFELAGSTLIRLAKNDVVDIRVFHNCPDFVVVEAAGRAYFSGVGLY